MVKLALGLDPGATGFALQRDKVSASADFIPENSRAQPSARKQTTETTHSFRLEPAQLSPNACALLTDSSIITKS